MPRQPSPRSRAIARLDDFRAGVYAVALHSEEWRERAQELADASAGMRAVQNSLERASAECADIQRLVSEGALTRDNAKVLAAAFHLSHYCLCHFSEASSLRLPEAPIQHSNVSYSTPWCFLLG